MAVDLVTIVVPVYKVEKYLDKCVESVLAQTYKNIEILLIDDGSPDKCPEMCDSWEEKDKRIRVIHKINNGISAARNTGIKNANGEFICFVDSDDFVEPNYIKSMLEIQNEKNSDVVFCKIKKVTENGEICETYQNENMDCFSKDPTIQSFFKFNITMSAARLLIKTNLAKKVLFDEQLKSGEDLNFLLRVLLCNPKCDYVDEFLYNYLKNSNSLTQTKNPETVKLQYIGVKKNADLLRSNGLIDIALCYEFEVYIHLIVCSLFINEMQDYIDNLKSKEHYKKYLSLTKPLSLKKRILAFLTYHKMYRTMRFLYKLKH